MKVSTKEICRFCLKLTNHFKTVDETTRAKLAFLLLDLDVTISHQPLICSTCLDNLEKLYNFKTSCLDAQTECNNTATTKDCLGIKSELADSITYDNNACDFCKVIDKHDIILRLSAEDITRVILMIEQIFPEFILNSAADCVTCIRCLESFKQHLRFVTDCLNVEERIKEYCKAEGANQGHVHLKMVLDSKSELIKTEENNCADPDIANIKNEIATEYLEIVEHIPHHDRTIFSSCGTFSTNGEIKPIASESTVKVYKCGKCTYETRMESNLKYHEATHINESDPKYKQNVKIKMFHCKICPYETEQKYSLKIHGQTHERIQPKMYNCMLCPYEAKYKHILNQHLKTHKYTSKVPMFKCEPCRFETTHHSAMKQHQLSHHKLIRRRKQCVKSRNVGEVRSELGVSGSMARDDGEANVDKNNSVETTDVVMKIEVGSEEIWDTKGFIGEVSKSEAV